MVGVHVVRDEELSVLDHRVCDHQLPPRVCREQTQTTPDTPAGPPLPLCSIPGRSQLEEFLRHPFRGDKHAVHAASKGGDVRINVQEHHIHSHTSILPELLKGKSSQGHWVTHLDHQEHSVPAERNQGNSFVLFSRIRFWLLCIFNVRPSTKS